MKKLTIDDIELPEGMLKAVEARWDSPAVPSITIIRDLQSALLWLAENPIVPTKEQIEECARHSGMDCSYYRHAAEVFTEWQRRMFLRKTAALPDEVKKLLCDAKNYCDGKRFGDRADFVNDTIIAAYQLGKEGK